MVKQVCISNINGTTYCQFLAIASGVGVMRKREKAMEIYIYIIIQYLVTCS